MYKRIRDVQMLAVAAGAVVLGLVIGTATAGTAHALADSAAATSQ